jgi:DNA-binding transcriptional LysR family regulator
MRSRFNLRQFEAFRAVYITNSFTGAGQFLNITQPAVSKLIADLEGHLGYPLFNRIKGKVEPTSRAHLIFDEFEKIHSCLDKLIDVAGSISPEAGKSLKIAALPIYADTIAPEFIKEFALAHPNTFCVLDAMASENLIHSVTSGDVDVGILSLPVDIQSLDEVSLHEDVAVLATPVGHHLANRKSVNINEIADTAYISLPLTSPYRQSLDVYFSANKFKPNITLMCRTQTAILRCVNLGLGVSIISRSMKYLTPPGVRFVELVAPLEWRLGLIVAKDHQLSAAAQSFCEMAIKMKAEILTI